MVVDSLNKLLSDYKVNRDFSKEIREGYRNHLEKDINLYFDKSPNYRYGGSLAKMTANSNSCDIDLLCYFDNDNKDNLETIYNKILKSLINASYLVEPKNSAICVMGKKGEDKWGITVDIVPGKYTSNNENMDVYLWCRRDKCKLKSNPELQIDKVLKSDCKDVIRLLKLYRSFNNFKFKSFYLEIFAIDIVQKEFHDSDNVYDKLVKFCSHYDEIGKVKIYDPANFANDINTIHTDYEFGIIRDKIEKLYKALLTNDEETILNCLKNKTYDIECGYINNAKSHFKHKGGLSKALIPLFNVVTITGFYKIDNLWNRFDSNTILNKKSSLRFEITVSPSLQKDSIVKLIVSNGGYEAFKHGCLRGNLEETKINYRANIQYFYRDEITSYYGNHCVQAYVKTSSGKIYYSDVLIVRVR